MLCIYLYTEDHIIHNKYVVYKYLYAQHPLKPTFARLCHPSLKTRHTPPPKSPGFCYSNVGRYGETCDECLQRVNKQLTVIKWLHFYKITLLYFPWNVNLTGVISAIRLLCIPHSNASRSFTMVKKKLLQRIEQVWTTALCALSCLAK